MSNESQVSHMLDQFIVDYGSPYHMRHDNANMEAGKCWK